jgi:23S rRNA (cytosine1962-C5)-methyltransferase
MHDLFLGRGYINPRSLISVRLLTRGKGDRQKFVRRRVQSAITLRKDFRKRCSWLILQGDFLPGLIVDATELLVLCLTAGMEEFKGIL